MLAKASGAGFVYHGFVEGDDIGKGTVDVVVTEGFTGNIALKTAEGTARQVGTYLRNALKADIFSMLGAMLAGKALNSIRRKLDPRNINGGVFLGLNGIVIKSHGGADSVGFGGISLTEHHLHENQGYQNSLLFASALAPRLKQATIVLATVNPALHHPVRLVESCNLIDQLNGGRLVVAFGSGFKEMGCEAVPQYMR